MLAAPLPSCPAGLPADFEAASQPASPRNASRQPPAKPLQVWRVCDIALTPPADHWLIRSVWARNAVGIIGGAPKCCKSWLGLDIAVSVASGTPCLGHYPVDLPGPVLVFMAEDALPSVRQRIQAICDHRRLDVTKLDVRVIDTPVLRLDLAEDQWQLAIAVKQYKPRLILLDPLVRLHRLDENSASEISGLLGYLRQLQRWANVAVVLVHHASKKQRSQPGQTLRGSSDLHAFGDSNAYLARRGDHLLLTLEHRAAQAPPPVPLQLTSQPDGSQTHLELHGEAQPPTDSGNIVELGNAVWQLLRRHGTPVTRQALRDQLRVNNSRLGDALLALEESRRAVRTETGWVAVQGATGQTQQQVLPIG